MKRECAHFVTSHICFVVRFRVTNPPTVDGPRVPEQRRSMASIDSSIPPPMKVPEPPSMSNPSPNPNVGPHAVQNGDTFSQRNTMSAPPNAPAPRVPFQLDPSVSLLPSHDLIVPSDVEGTSPAREAHITQGITEVNTQGSMTNKGPLEGTELANFNTLTNKKERPSRKSNKPNHFSDYRQVRRKRLSSRDKCRDKSHD